MLHRNNPSPLVAAFALGLCAILGACGSELDDAGLSDSLTDDYIDQDVPPGVQDIEDVECHRGSICARVILDDSTECVLEVEDVERATEQDIVQRCQEEGERSTLD